MEEMRALRKFVKANFTEWEDIESDQDKKLQQPPLEKAYDVKGEIIDLPKAGEDVIVESNIGVLINNRKSRRKYTQECLTLEELGFLLWATQGVKNVTANNYSTRRTVPSAGARHPFETYLVINQVEGLKKGIYRYIALTHKLLFVAEDENLQEKLVAAVLDQAFVGNSAVVFLWSCIPYRAEWRYYISAHRHILIDIGHVCQNLYMACEAIGCGTCAIAAYDQAAIDELLCLDGEEEFIVYLAPVGKYN